MTKIEYDFREGLDRDHIIYKKSGYDWDFSWKYILYLIATYVYTAAWFALFHYAYITNEPTAFWTYIAFWLLWVILIVSIAVSNLIIHYRNKRIRKAKEAEEEERRKKDEDAQMNKVIDRKPNETNGDNPISNLIK